MLSTDGKDVLCDVRGCGKAAVGGCELRIHTGYSGSQGTIPGDLIAWCKTHEESIREKIESEFIPFNPARLKAGYTARGPHLSQNYLTTK
jgi:hypothetical protein